jgi:hypothetical protein
MRLELWLNNTQITKGNKKTVDNLNMHDFLKRFYLYCVWISSEIMFAGKLSLILMILP